MQQLFDSTTMDDRIPSMDAKLNALLYIAKRSTPISVPSLRKYTKALNDYTVQYQRNSIMYLRFAIENKILNTSHTAKINAYIVELNQWISRNSELLNDCSQVALLEVVEPAEVTKTSKAKAKLKLSTSVLSRLFMRNMQTEV